MSGDLCDEDIVGDVLGFELVATMAPSGSETKSAGMNRLWSTRTPKRSIPRAVAKTGWLILEATLQTH
jgi:hypothetical protein